jgi:hypothetical protein
MKQFLVVFIAADANRHTRFLLHGNAAHRSLRRVR